jgi:membrane protein DedA with SNARE-associated domain
MWVFPELSAFLIAHGTALILPLAVIEGPVVAIIGGALSARGYLEWPVVLALLVSGDLIGDAIHYSIGRYGGAPLAALSRRFHIDETKAAGIADRLRRDSTRMLFVGKWTHAIGAFVLIGAGAVRVPFPRYMLVNLLATLPKSAALLAVGYFAGNIYPLIAPHLLLGTIVLLGVGLAALALILRRRAHPTGGDSPP